MAKGLKEYKVLIAFGFRINEKRQNYLFTPYIFILLEVLQ